MINAELFLYDLQLSDKKHAIVKKKMEQKERKEEMLQNKTENLRKMRENIDKQKIINKNSKNIQ
jgi:ribosome-binding ATPase YchF (GTP1/OBG family)